MPTIGLNLTGGTYKHRSLPISAQVSRNLWPQKVQNEVNKSPYILQAFVGQKAFGTAPDGVCRGAFEHRSFAYRVCGTKLYLVAADGTHTELGNIPGTNRCIFCGIGSKIVVTTEGVPYQYNGSIVTPITDIDLETPNSAAHLNNQIIYDGDDGRFGTSDVGDATSVDGLNYATAESDADDLERVYTFLQILWLMGDKTFEGWYNSGVGQPPFDRIEGAIIKVGLGALHSPANSKDFLYFLGHDKSVYGIVGQDAKAISTDALVKEISSYERIDDAFGMCFKIDEQWFYALTFPAANKTWIFIEGTTDWFEWSSGTQGGRNRANSYVYAYGKHLVGDYNSAAMYELDMATYSETGNPLVRQRDTGPLHGGLFGKPGKDLEINRFELIMETGVGILSGQGEDPEVMLSFSDDGGHTFSTEMRGKIGRMGAFIWKVQWHALGKAASRVFRIKYSDPTAFSIHSAAADVEACI